MGYFESSPLPTPILKFYTAARGSRLYFCSEKSVSPFFLFLFPIPLWVLNPPARLGLLYPAFREDRFDFGHRFSRDVIGLGDFEIERLAVAVFRVDELLDLCALLEI